MKPIGNVVLVVILVSIGLIDCSENNFTDCGSNDKLMVFKNITLDPHPIKYPGTLKLSVTLDVLKDIDLSDSQLKLKIEKVSPNRVRIPCIFQLGSCGYVLCDLWKKYIHIIKKHTIDRVVSDNCTLSAGTLTLSNIELRIGRFAFLKAYIQGDYTVNANIHTISNEKTFACIQSNFTIEQNLSKIETENELDYY